MSWKIEGESITPDKTRMYFRADGGAAPDYWEIEIITSPHRTWRTIRHDGWHVADLDTREFIEGHETRWCGKVREPIPDVVLSHLPKPHSDFK